MARNFRYRERNPEEIDRRARQTGGDYQGFIQDEFKTYAPKKGQNCVRILPPTFDHTVWGEHYGLPVYAHRGIGPGGKATVLCLNHMKNVLPRGIEGGNCPICEEVARLDRAGEDEEAKEIAAKKRCIVWVIDRDNERDGPMIWNMPWTSERDIAKISKDRQSGEYYVIDHPDHGYDLSFDREGEGKITKYGGWQLARKATSVDDDFLEYVDACPLDECLIWRDYEEIVQLFESGGGGEDREPAPRKRAAGSGNGKVARFAPPRRREAAADERPVRRSQPPPDPEDEDEDEDEDEAEKAEVQPRRRFEPPQRPAAAAPRRQLREPPPGEGLDPEDEEEAPPPRRSREAPAASGSGGASRAAALRERYGRH